MSPAFLRRQHALGQSPVRLIIPAILAAGVLISSSTASLALAPGVGADRLRASARWLSRNSAEGEPIVSLHTGDHASSHVATRTLTSSGAPTSQGR